MKLHRVCPKEMNVIAVDVDASRCYRDQQGESFWINGAHHYASESKAWSKLVQYAESCVSLAEIDQRKCVEDLRCASEKVLQAELKRREVEERYDDWIAPQLGQ